jgi:hypothetical protein
MPKLAGYFCCSAPSPLVVGTVGSRGVVVAVDALVMRVCVCVGV